MSIKRDEVEKIIEANHFARTRATKKVVEYRSERSGKVFYFRKDIGLPIYVRIVTHPNQDVSTLLALDGVVQNPQKEFQHGSNMMAFPKEVHEGKEEIHFGRALNIDSLAALTAFSSTFHHI